jgi:hypothetical protein
VSGDRLVAQRIAGLSQGSAVKKCLQALFTHELDNADKIMPKYKDEYERVIEKLASSWEPENDGGGTK